MRFMGFTRFTRFSIEVLGFKGFTEF